MEGIQETDKKEPVSRISERAVVEAKPEEVAESMTKTKPEEAAKSMTETKPEENQEQATVQPQLLTAPESEEVSADEEEANSEAVPVAEEEENSEVTLSDTEEPDLQKENGSEE